MSPAVRGSGTPSLAWSFLVISLPESPSPAWELREEQEHGSSLCQHLTYVWKQMQVLKRAIGGQTTVTLNEREDSAQNYFQVGHDGEAGTLSGR